MNAVTVRRLSIDHEAERVAWRAVRDLCCRTGNNGSPIDAARWDFFSRIWIVPYETILPEWTYVAESDAAIVGYLTGCPDSAKFSRMRLWRATLPLLVAIAGGRYRQVPGAREFLKQALVLRQTPERCISRDLARKITRDFPAHLHINIAAGNRRQGLGRCLIDSYFADLRSCQVAGVHLFCGPDPVEFYGRLGFRQLEKIELNGAVTFLLGVRL